VCQEPASGQLWGAGNVCCFLPPPSAGYCSPHAFADITEQCPGFLRALQGCTPRRDARPKRGHRESREGPVWGHRVNKGQGLTAEHGLGQAEALGAAEWEPDREEYHSREARARAPGGGKPSLETWCKRESTVGKWRCA